VKKIQENSILDMEFSKLLDIYVCVEATLVVPCSSSKYVTRFFSGLGFRVTLNQAQGNK